MSWLRHIGLNNEYETNTEVMMKLPGGEVSGELATLKINTTALSSVLPVYLAT